MGTSLEPSAPVSPETPRSRLPNWATVSEAAVFLVFSIFFLLYGQTPIFGGDGLGLVGADEPRYAQIAHEMLDRFDSAHTLKARLGACVTPYLYGRPWLEKPALYYWRAMFLFREFGVHDWSARLPSASFAFIMAALIYLHMRRFRPGGHLDAALITVACASIIGFARGASTDMQMAAPFSIGLLGWYAWYETDSKFWLFDIYFFTGVATLAKGPVAPFLAIAVVLAFATLRNEWSIVRRSLWWPGVALYFAIVLPWFIAVQNENPTFFREFFLGAQPAALRHQSFPARAALVVLHRGGDPGTDAVDGARDARADRRNPDLGGGVAPAPRASTPSESRIGRATHFLNSWCSGRSFPSSSSRFRSPSCRVTSCPRSRPSRFSPATISSGSAQPA